MMRYASYLALRRVVAFREIGPSASFNLSETLAYRVFGNACVARECGTTAVMAENSGRRIKLVYRRFTQKVGIYGISQTSLIKQTCFQRGPYLNFAGEIICLASIQFNSPF